MKSEYRSLRRSIAQFRSIDLVLTWCVDIGALPLKETGWLRSSGPERDASLSRKGSGDEACAACRVSASAVRSPTGNRGSADRLRPKLVRKRRPLISNVGGAVLCTFCLHVIEANVSLEFSILRRRTCSSRRRGR